MSQSLLSKQILYVTGLPRAGSTLLCQLLSTHPQIASSGHSSPLASIIEQIRHTSSDNPFLLAQLDVDFERGYTRLLSAYRGLLAGWVADTDQPIVVDKNRAWLPMIETVRLLDPNFRMLVCLRDPVAVFGSVEAQHQRTLLLEFPDHLSSTSAYDRADVLFGKQGVIGGPLRAIEHLQDIANDGISARIRYIHFEELMTNPRGVMTALYAWAGLPDGPFDPLDLPVRPHESDSYYRFKYLHAVRSRISPPAPHAVSARIAREIVQKYRWFYQHFYPELYPEFQA